MKLFSGLFMLAAATLVTLAQAEPLQTVLQSKTQQAQAAIYPSTRSHLDAVFPITLRVQARFENQVGKDNILNKTCTAVLIDPNYLLASQTCKGLDENATCRDHNGEATCRKVAYRKITSIEINGRPAKAFFEDSASKTILIEANPADAKTVETLAGKPNANLFIMTQPSTRMFTQAAVNKEGLLWGRNSKIFQVKQVCNKNGCFFLPTQAQTGDPAFFFSTKKLGMEFLAGFNQAEPDGTDLGSGFFYRPLNKSLISFLQKHVSPNSWKRLQNKIVTESFFK